MFKAFASQPLEGSAKVLSGGVQVQLNDLQGCVQPRHSRTSLVKEVQRALQDLSEGIKSHVRGSRPHSVAQDVEETVEEEQIGSCTELRNPLSWCPPGLEGRWKDCTGYLERGQS